MAPASTAGTDTSTGNTKTGDASTGDASTGDASAPGTSTAAATSPRRRAGAILATGPGTSAVAVAGALAIGAFLVAISGASPWSAFTGLLDGAFGDRYHLGETVVRAIPLAIVALGVTPALRAGVFSVGSEGQLAMGAAASVAAILAVRDGPALVLVAVGMLFGALGGAAWAFVPAVLRARFRVNEILSTLMMNYLAASLLLWLLKHPLKNSQTVATPRSDNLPKAALVPNLLSQTRLHWGVVLVVAGAAALAWWVRTVPGFAYDVFGVRPALGARMGVREDRAVVSTMLVAGAAAGVAGWLQVAALQGTLYASVAGGLGFSGVVVAILGDLKPAGIVAGALLFGALGTGADGLQVGTGVPASIATVLYGLLLVAAALVFAARQQRVRGRLVDPTNDGVVSSGTNPTGPGPTLSSGTNPTGPGPTLSSGTNPTGPGPTLSSGTNPTGPGPTLSSGTNPTGPGPGVPSPDGESDR